MRRSGRVALTSAAADHWWSWSGARVELESAGALLHGDLFLQVLAARQCDEKSIGTFGTMRVNKRMCRVQYAGGSWARLKCSSGH